VLLGIVLLASAAGLASASALAVSGGALSTADASHPCPGTATALASGGTLTVTLPSAACAGLPVQVTTLTSSGTPVGAGTATVSGRTAVVDVATTGATGAVATVNGWALPLTWTSAGPIYPESPAISLTDVTWDLVTNNPIQVCFHGTVTTSSPTPVPWALTIDLGQAPFNGAESRSLSLQGTDGWRYKVDPDQPAVGYAQIVGTARGGRETIEVGQSYRVDVCDYRLPPGVDTPSAYTVSTAHGSPWSDTTACIDTTITGNGTSMFYVGWSAQVDMAPAIARLAQANHTASAWSYGSNDWMVERSQTSATTFAVTARAPADIAGTGSFTFTICAVSN
jgi:hypothetical protein